MHLSNNPITFKAAVKLHADFWENNMNHIEIANNFEINFMKTLRFDIAYEYGLLLHDADELISKLYIKSVEDLNSRFFCHISHYSMLGGLEFLDNDLYSAYGYVPPYDIVHGLIVARKPLEQL